MWEGLQGEKEEVAREIVLGGPLCLAALSEVQGAEDSEKNGSEIEWRHRAQLEARLRELNDAQDRLMDGAYGRCTDCGVEIDNVRLAADPASALCMNCEQRAESEVVFHTM